MNISEIKDFIGSIRCFNFTEFSYKIMVKNELGAKSNKFSNSCPSSLLKVEVVAPAPQAPVAPVVAPAALLKLRQHQLKKASAPAQAAR